MGLDMNLYARINVDLKDNLEYKHQKPSFVFVEVGYWRRGHAIHEYITKSFLSNDFDSCCYLYLSRKNLEQIRDWCIKNTDDYMYSFDITRDIIVDALNMNNASIHDFYYSASW